MGRNRGKGIYGSAPSLVARVILNLRMKVTNVWPPWFLYNITYHIVRYDIRRYIRDQLTKSCILNVNSHLKPPPSPTSSREKEIAIGKILFIDNEIKIMPFPNDLCLFLLWEYITFYTYDMMM